MRRQFITVWFTQGIFNTAYNGLITLPRHDEVAAGILLDDEGIVVGFPDDGLMRDFSGQLYAAPFYTALNQAHQLFVQYLFPVLLHGNGVISEVIRDAMVPFLQEILDDMRARAGV